MDALDILKKVGREVSDSSDLVQRPRMAEDPRSQQSCISIDGKLFNIFGVLASLMIV